MKPTWNRRKVLSHHSGGCQLIINANFCSGCGCRQRNYDLFESSDSEEDLIRKYFKYGYNYQTVCLFLEKFHGIEISLRTLKRRLAQYVLKKASNDISDETLPSIIEREVKGPSSLKGYRNIWNKLRMTYCITVPRDRVMYLLRCIDPNNTAMRQTKTIGKVSLPTYKHN